MIRITKTSGGTAKGSHQWVDVNRYTTLPEPVNKLKASGHQIVAAHFSDQAIDFREVDYTKPTALLMGSERDGLSDEGNDLADYHVTVPMVGMVASFNVSVAAGIILTEAQYQRQKAGLYDRCRIDEAEFQRLFFQWGHPQIRHFCESKSLDYPPLREDGEIDNPSQWYSDIRDILAKKA